MRVEFENTSTVSGKSNISGIISRLYGWVYKTWRLFPLADEHSVAVWLRVPNQDDPRLYPMGSQFSISVLLNLCSESVEAYHFEILAEVSNTGCPSSFTVRMKYLFAFQFWCCKLCAEQRGRERGKKHCFVSFCSLTLLYLSVGEGLWVGTESLI